MPAHPQQEQRSTDAVWAAAIFLMALITRLSFLLSMSDRALPHSAFYEGDAPVWVQWAQALGRGEPFEFDLPLRTPGVAYLLHWFSRGEPGPSFVMWKIAWCAMSAAACAIAYLAFRAQFSQRISLIAALLCILSFELHITSTSLNNETPYMLVLVTAVWLTLRLRRQPVWLAGIIALLHGLGMLLRAEHALMLALMTLYVTMAKPTHCSAWTSSFRTRLSFAAIIAIGAVVICLPWSIRGAMAIHRFNTQFSPLPEYERAVPVWTAEARAYLDSLPAFAREANFRFITDLTRAQRKQAVTRDDVQTFFTQRFDYVPQPLSRFALVSMKGPLDFALANHRQANGGFSKAALGGDEVNLTLARPDHLKLINHGYAVGLGEITGDLPRWLGLVGNKLRNFLDGVTLGFTARNIPLGVDGEARPVDLLTPKPDQAIVWRVLILGLVAAGIAVAIVQRTGGVWLIIIAYKLIITIMFYGYARQAVSILPAFYIFIALALDWLLTAFRHVRPRALSAAKRTASSSSNLI